MIFSFDSEEMKEFPKRWRFSINYATEKIKEDDNRSFEAGIPKLIS